MATYERLDYGSADGSQWGGASSDALGFYGTTPCTQYQDVPAASTYTVTSAAGTTFGFTTAASFQNCIATVSSMAAAMKRIGMVS